ncbi:hypothetical protein DMH12_15335 [Streptomyces sp. WAC 04229]|uniref:hypothetical protein n=1 Tax=Streptomyces sp. WAC 04229 TaxID=2203206 RepID=UPI000F748B57|nr:hypothetical protein [Streptomyces sp. WAC 04229]RSN55590.1 hypothetical protein DMH12_15335 [Streptomyces sp. WAC 04229]
MTTTGDEDLPVPSEAFARAMQPTLDRIREAMARDQQARFEQMRIAITPMTRLQTTWDRYVRDVLVPAQEARNNQAHQVVQSWLDSYRTQYQSARWQSPLLQAAARAAAGFDTTGLNRLLHDVDAWRALSDEQRTATVAAAESAYLSADEDAVPDDLVAELEETAREFAGGDVQYLPIEVRRQSFVLFVGTVVLLALMTLSFSNDTADEVMAKALEVGPAVGLVALAAGRAWDRNYGVRRDDDNGEDS